MIFAAVHVGAGHNTIFFYCVTSRQGLAGSFLCQMIMSYSVIEMFSLCDERCPIL